MGGPSNLVSSNRTPTGIARPSVSVDSGSRWSVTEPKQFFTTAELHCMSLVLMKRLRGD